jgi:predicted TIM-barrel fold metal-dependent hydrolase
MIIDSHAHFADKAVHIFEPDFMKLCLDTMDRLGVDYMIRSLGKALGHGPHADFDRHVEEGSEIFEESGKRVFSYFVYTPFHSDFCIKMIEENHDNPAFVGIKIHPSVNNFYADEEAFRLVYEVAKKYGFPILSHTWALTSNPNQKYSVPERFERFIREYSEVNFIFGHSGGRVEGIKKAVEIGTRYKNAYYDIAGDIYDRRLIEYICSHVGADHLLFGSDLPWFDPASQMGMVLGANLTTEEKELILGGNASKLFGIK